MQVLGRLHPLLVHLPIGILLLSFGLECLARYGRRPDLRPAIRLALAAGACSALVTVGTGWLLSRQGGYDEVLLQRHQWLGFGATFLALLAWWGQSRRWYFPVFAFTVLVLTGAGHFGGSLTHGVNYLFENNPGNEQGTGATPLVFHPDSAVFAGLIQPLLERKCLGCHNASKHKGKLRLDAPVFIRQGGEHGAVFKPGDAANSPLLQRLQLPLHHDDHMPPAGKPQLSGPEIRLIEWWIAQGADFAVKQRDAVLPVDLKNSLQKAPAVPQNPVFALKINAASGSDIQRLRDLRVAVQPLGKDAPWLAVSFAGLSHPAKEHWEALRRVNAQIADLDLAFTDAGDAVLPDLPHVVQLNLAHTAVTDAIGPALNRMPYLESLNLTGTTVTDTLLKSLAPLAHLQRLYLWKTAVSAEAVAGLRQQRPQLYIETGATAADTARLALRAPKLLFGRSFFDDTLLVALDFPSVKGVSLYYTLDEAASPTTQSAQYRDKILLQQTTHLRAFAAKAGWLPSPVVDALFVKKKFTPLKASLEKLPSPKYPAQGAPSLIDGKIAAEQGADTWLGYEGEHLGATLDLGRADTVRRVFVHCLENNVSWIFKPVGIEVQTSVDGQVFKPAGKSQFSANAAMGETKTHLLACDLAKPAPARYVRVLVKSLLKNPVWHPGKGQKCWIFVDEIMVE